MSINIYIFSSEEKDPMATILEQIGQLSADVTAEKAQIDEAISALESAKSELLAKVSDLEAKLAEAIANLPAPEEVQAAIEAIKADISSIYEPPAV